MAIDGRPGVIMPADMTNVTYINLRDLIIPDICGHIHYRGDVFASVPSRDTGGKNVIFDTGRG